MSEPNRHDAGLMAHRKAEQLTRLFNSSRNTWGIRDTPYQSSDMFYAVLSGRVTIRLSHLPADVCATALRSEVGRFGSEGEDHARLKLAAMLWMRAEGAADAEPEVRDVNGIADAYSDDACWIVECGNTPFRKLAQAALWDTSPRFTLIPFQSFVRQDGSPRRLIAVDFSWGEDLTAELNAKQWERMTLIASSLTAGRRRRPPSPTLAGER